MSLHHLTINDGEMTDPSICKIIESCPYLLFLDLSSCSKITGFSVVQVTESCPGLQYFDLSECNSIIHIPPQANKLDKLKCLKMSNRANIEDDEIVAMLIAMANICPNAEEVYFQDIEGIEGISDPKIVEIAVRCPILQKLSLCFLHDSGDDDMLWRIAQGCPNLRVLSLAFFHNMTYAEIFSILDRCTQLEELDLSYTNVGDAVVVKIAKNCPNLWLLSLKMCCDVTDIGIVCLAEGCPSLMNLDLDMSEFGSLNEMINDIGICKIADCCSKLKRLNLDSCVNITDTAILRLIDGCPDLEWLDISRIYGISDVSISRLDEINIEYEIE